MTDFAPHPARSAEFLSRLHDGDLSAAERVRFESHRAHCAECRNAAAEFEAALLLYRSSRLKPASPDLAARILRRLQSASPRRSRFGVTFGIDLRWAGAFAAALLAVIIGSAVVMRREAAERKLARQAAPISVVMEGDQAAGLKKDQAAAPAPATKAREAQSRDERAAAAPAPRRKVAEAAKPEFAQAPSDARGAPAELAPLENESGVQVAPQKKREGRLVDSKPQAQASSLSKEKESAAGGGRAQDRSGGEGSLSSNMATDKLNVLDKFKERVRLEILALDGAGTAPPLVETPGLDLPASLRGQEFRLVVDASGRVREVTPMETRSRKKAFLRQEPPRSDDAAETDVKTSHPLKDLRFQAGDRPRVLRVRVE